MFALTKWNAVRSALDSMQAVAINTAVIGFLFAIVLVVFSALTVPDIPWVKLLLLELPLMAFGPILFYPYSKTLWVAIDRAFLSHL